METEKRIVHNVPDGSGDIVATCGDRLGVNVGGYYHTGRYGVPRLTEDDAAVCGHCLAAVS